MSDIVGVVTGIKDDSYDGKDFKVVTLGTGQVLKVKHGRDDFLKNKWGLLQVGAGIKFIMKDFTTKDQVKIPFVSDIETVASALPDSGGAATILPEHQAEIDKALNEPKELPPPAPQAVGMITNNLTTLMLEGMKQGSTSTFLKPLFGIEASIELAKWYRSQVLGITRIKFEGKDLPDFEAH